MSYFDQFYIKTCFRQVWKIVKCKLLEVFLLAACKSVSLNWPSTERSHALLLFYLSCKLKRVGRLHDVKQLFWKPANDKNCFKLHTSWSKISSRNKNIFPAKIYSRVLNILWLKFITQKYSTKKSCLFNYNSPFQFRNKTVYNELVLHSVRIL